MKSGEQGGGSQSSPMEERKTRQQHPVFQPSPHLVTSEAEMVMEKQWDLHRPLHANLTFVPAKQSGFVYDGQAA